jgi:biopolymer transport protein ExbD
MHTRPSRRDRRAKSAPVSVGLTPMIDVVFLILIYFVLTFEVPDRLSQMKVWRPEGTKLKPQIPLMRVTVFDDAYTLNDVRVSLATLERSFNRFADLDPTRNLIVVAAADSKHKHLVDVLDLLNKAGLQNISLLSAE